MCIDQADSHILTKTAEVLVNPCPPHIAERDLTSFLKMRFPGISAPRWTCEGQKQAIAWMAIQNPDMSVCLPTGMGKSLLYEVPALSFNKDKATVVVLPFVSLMDQAEERARRIGLNVVKMSGHNGPPPTERGLVLMSAEATARRDVETYVACIQSYAEVALTLGKVGYRTTVTRYVGLSSMKHMSFTLISPGEAGSPT